MYQQLKGRDATFVRTAGRRLKEQCDEISGAMAKRAYKVAGYSMGSVSQRLGHLLAGPGGSGAAILSTAPRPGASPTTGYGNRAVIETATGVATSSASEPAVETRSAGTSDGIGPRPRGRRRPSLIDEPRYEVISGKPMLVQLVRLHGSGRSQGQVSVITGDGSAESNSPTGALTPSIHGWRTAEGAIVPGDVLYHSGDAADVELIVNAVPDAVLSIGVMGQV